MSDDDFLIPRHYPMSETEADTSSLPEQQAQGLRIDPRVSEERCRRKKSLMSQPKTIHDDPDQPWSHVDRRIGDAFPCFDEPMWTLGATARWVAERTREAVDGWSIDQEQLFEVVPEIQIALAAGEVRTWAHTTHDPVPRELPRETWAVYQLAIEERDGLLRIIPVRATGSPSDEPVLLDLLLGREGVLHRWPDPEASTHPRDLGTIASENACRLWLVDLMKTNPHNPRSKEAVRQEAKERFTNLGKRGFDRAWAAAIKETMAEKWSAPGRRS
jgi:hypothetical protein